MPNIVDPFEDDRIATIDAFARDKCVPGHEALIAKMRADGYSTAGDVALAVIREINASHAAAAAAVSAGAASGAHATTDRFPDLDAVERSALATWASSGAIRAEFSGNKASYVSFRKAEAKGLVRPRNRS